MWTFSPSLVVIVGTIFSASLIWNRIWYGKISQSEQKSHHPVYLIGRGIGRTLYAFVGLLLLDSVLRICFSNLLSYGHFKYALSSVILGIFFGIYLLIGTVFMAPTWKTLVTFIAMVGAMVYLGILSITSEDVDYTDLILITLAVGLIMEIIENVGDFLYRSKRQDGTQKIVLSQIFTTVSPPLWNTSKKLSSLFTLKIYFIIFMIFFFELMLLFEGLTIFVWL
jgi:hypothetical protein